MNNLVTISLAPLLIMSCVGSPDANNIHVENRTEKRDLNTDVDPQLKGLIKKMDEMRQKDGHDLESFKEWGRLIEQFRMRVEYLAQEKAKGAGIKWNPFYAGQLFGIRELEGKDELLIQPGDMPSRAELRLPDSCRVYFPTFTIPKRNRRHIAPV